MTRKGFDSNIHKRMLTILLLDICKNLGKKIAFKGGTAGMMFYNLPRLSLDLDFDALEEIDEKHQKKIEFILNNHGLVLEKENKKHTIFFLFSYSQDSPNIKIEINKRIWENNSYKEKQLMGVSIKIQDESTTLSNKMVALINRKSPVVRDLFDIHFFLTMHFQPNRKLIKERTSINFSDFLENSIKHIDDNFNEKNILQGIGELIDDSQKLWVKKNLVPETKELIKKQNKLRY